MSSAVTKDGVRGARPGTEAIVGPGPVGDHRPRRPRRDGERAMVPDATFSSYYGLPILKAPTWKEREIAGYIFLGGLAGASSLLAATARRGGRRALATRADVAATVAVSLGGAALVKDLGRPERFANMLRTFKPTSPMSVGAWLLAGYAPLSAIAAATALTGRFRRTGTAAGTGAAVLGSMVATYTAALVADTAVPAWHTGRRHLPLVFAGSSAMAAGGTALVLGPGGETGPARRFALAGMLLELGATAALERRDDVAVEPYRTGRAGRMSRTGRALAIGGAAIAVVAGRRRVPQVAAGALLVAASACTRLAVFSAGVQSVADPRYVVEPQRAPDARRADATR
jgi:hypothetical protein